MKASSIDKVKYIFKVLTVSDITRDKLTQGGAWRHTAHTDTKWMKLIISLAHVGANDYDREI